MPRCRLCSRFCGVSSHRIRIIKINLFPSGIECFEIFFRASRKSVCCKKEVQEYNGSFRGFLTHKCKKKGFKKSCIFMEDDLDSTEAKARITDEMEIVGMKGEIIPPRYRTRVLGFEGGVRFYCKNCGKKWEERFFVRWKASEMIDL